MNDQFTKEADSKEPSDHGWTHALQDAIEVLNACKKDAETDKGYHYNKITYGKGNVPLGDMYKHHRSLYEFYDGKCGALAEAITVLQSLRSEVLQSMTSEEQ